MKCNKCGNIIEDNQKFCNQCGEPVVESNEVKVETTENKKTSKSFGILFIGVAVALVSILLILGIIVIVAILLMVRKGDNDDKTTTTSTTTTEITTATLDDDKNKKVLPIDFTNISFKPEDNDDESNNIEFVKGYMNVVKSETATRYAYIGLINKNSENLDITVYINYYKDGVRIGSDYAIKSFIKPNVITVVEVTLQPKDEYDKVDITYTTNPGAAYMKDVPVTSKNYTKINENKKKALNYGQFTNDSKKKIYGYASCVRYKNNEIVFIHPGHLGEVEVGKKGNCTCYDLDLDENLDYDKTECVLNNVYYTEGE